VTLLFHDEQWERHFNFLLCVENHTLKISLNKMDNNFFSNKTEMSGSSLNASLQMCAPHLTVPSSAGSGQPMDAKYPPHQEEIARLKVETERVLALAQSHHSARLGYVSKESLFQQSAVEHFLTLRSPITSTSEATERIRVQAMVVDTVPQVVYQRFEFPETSLYFQQHFIAHIIDPVITINHNFLKGDFSPPAHDEEDYYYSTYVRPYKNRIYHYVEFPKGMFPGARLAISFDPINKKILHHAFDEIEAHRWAYLQEHASVDTNEWGRLLMNRYLMGFFFLPSTITNRVLCDAADFDEYDTYSDESGYQYIAALELKFTHRAKILLEQMFRLPSDFICDLQVQGKVVAKMPPPPVPSRPIQVREPVINSILEPHGRGNIKSRYVRGSKLPPLDRDGDFVPVRPRSHSVNIGATVPTLADTLSDFAVSNPLLGPVINSKVPVPSSDTIKPLLVEPVIEQLKVDGKDSEKTYYDSFGTMFAASDLYSTTVDHEGSKYTENMFVDKLTSINGVEDKVFSRKLLLLLGGPVVLDSSMLFAVTRFYNVLLQAGPLRDQFDFVTFGAFDLEQALTSNYPHAFQNFAKKIYDSFDSVAKESFGPFDQVLTKYSTRPIMIDVLSNSVQEITLSLAAIADQLNCEQGRDIVRFITAFALAGVSYYRLPDWKTLALECLKLLVSFSYLVPKALIETAQSALHELLNKDVVVQGLSIFEDTIYDVMGLFCYESILSYFGLLGEGWKFVKKFLNPKVSMATFIEKIFALAKSVINACLEYLSTGSTQGFIKTKPTPSEWIMGATLLSEHGFSVGFYDPKFVQDHLKQCPYLPREWYQCAAPDHIQFINKWLAIAVSYSVVELSERTNKALYLQFTAALSKLRECKQRLVINVTKTKPRLVPLSLLLVGPPGAGKSTLLTELARLLAFAENREYSPTNTFTWDPNLNYDDTYDPSQDFYVMDDANARPIPANPNYTDKTFVSALKSFVNTVAANAESANVNHKGENFHNPKLIVQTMNAIPKRTDVLKLEISEGAYFSRIHYVIKVSTQDGQNWRINPPKVARWFFDVFQLTERGQLTPRLHRFCDLGLFQRWVLDTYTSFRDKQQLLSSTIESKDRDSQCPVCNIAARFHPDLPCDPIKDNPFQSCDQVKEEIVLVDTAIAVQGSGQNASDTYWQNYMKSNINNFNLLLSSSSSVRSFFRILFEIAESITTFDILSTIVLLYTFSSTGWIFYKLFMQVYWLLLFRSRWFLLWLGHNTNFYMESGIKFLVNSFSPSIFTQTIQFASDVNATLKKVAKLKVWGKAIMSALSMTAGVYALYRALVPRDDDRKRRCMDLPAPLPSQIPVPIVSVKDRSEVFVNPFDDPSESFTKVVVQGAPKKEAVWTTINKIPTIPSSTINWESGFEICQKNTGSLRFLYYDHREQREKYQCTKAVKIAPRQIIFNKHSIYPALTDGTTASRVYMFDEGMKFKLEFQFGSQIFDVEGIIGVNLCQHPFKDLMLLDTNLCAPLGKCVYDLLPPFCETSRTSYANAWYSDNPKNQLRCGLLGRQSDPTHVLLNMTGSDRVGATDGLCGTPILVKYGNNPVVVALHWGASEIKNELGERIPIDSSWGLLLSQDDIKLMTRTQLKVQSSILTPTDRILPLWKYTATPDNFASAPLLDPPALLPLPAYSEMAHGVRGGNASYEVLGTLPGKFHNQRFKTRLEKVPAYDSIKQFAEEYGETSEWRIPVWRSNIGDPDNRVNPWTLKIKNTRNATPNLLVLEKAKRVLEDKLDSFPWENVYIKPLDQAFAGNSIPFSSNRSKPVDTSTSTGLPYNIKKGDIIQLGNEFIAITDEMLSSLVEILDRMIEDPDLIVLPIANGSIKDEIISKKKFDSNKMRVFWICSVQFILLQRIVLGSVLDIFQAHGLHIGLAIGRNYNDRVTMASIAEKMRQVAPDFASAHCFSAGDMEGQDDKVGVEINLGCFEPLYNSIKKKARVSPEELNLIRRVLIACCYSIRIVKADVAFVNGGNISGQLVTALLNCLANILMHIYSFYRIEELWNFDFWQVVFLEVMGDDSRGTIAKPIRHLYNQFSIQKGFAECGVPYTTCHKEADFSSALEKLDDIVFLQFRMFFDQELEEWRSALAYKSIFKALMYYEKKPSCSSDALINSTLCNMTLAVYYKGRAEYDKFTSRLASIYPNYPFRSYNDLRAIELAEETVFVEQDEVPIQLVSEDVRINSTSEIKMNMVTEEASAGASHAETPAALKVSPTESLYRWTHLSELTLGGEAYDADVAGTPFPVIAAYFQNPLVATLIPRMRTWRGSFKLKLVITGVPTSYSMYAATVLPADVTDATFAENYPMSVASMLQRDSVIINTAMSSEIEFDLPFVSMNRTALCAVDLDLYGSDWYLYVKTVFPVRDVFVVSPTAKINVYIKPNSDFGFESLVVNARSYSKLPPQQIIAQGWFDSIKRFLAHPVSTGLSAASTLASALGYSRTLSKETHRPMHIKPYPDLSACDGGLSDVITTGLFNNSSLEPGFCNEDEMLVSNLVTRETLVSPAAWTNSDARLTVLDCIPITPFLSVDEGTTTVGGYIGAPFQYWRSDITFKVMVACNNMHSGSLIMFHSPSSIVAGSVLANDPTNRSMCVTVDISQNISQSITIPWLSEFNALPVKFVDLLETSPTGLNGFFIIAVANPLNGPGTTLSVGIATTLACSNNFSVGLYRPFATAARESASTEPWLENLVINGDVNTTNIVSTDMVMLGGLPASPVMGTMLFSEQFLSIKSLLLKFSIVDCPISFYNNEAEYGVELVHQIPFYPFPKVAALNPARRWQSTESYNGASNLFVYGATRFFNMQAYYSAMFHGVRGSQLLSVYAFHGQGSAMSIASFGAREITGSGGNDFADPIYSVAPASTQGLMGNGGLWLGSSNTPSFAAPSVIRLPYASPFNYWPVYGSYTALSALTKTIEATIVLKHNSGVNSQIYFFSAAGDDICLFHFRYTPKLLVSV